MIVDKILPDEEFGHLYIRTNSRAVRYTFRLAQDGTPKCGILITVPVRYELADVRRAVEEMRPRLRQMLQQHAGKMNGNDGEGHRPHIDWNFKIETDSLCIYIVKGTREGFYLHHDEAKTCVDSSHDIQMVTPAVLQVVCPPDCDFDVEGRQEWLEKVICEGIRSHAKRQLIPRLRHYACLYNIQLNEVKINSSRGRWGSCGRHTQRTPSGSSQYFNINLSLFTLLLPLPVQKLVLLHELNHTRHMDHSAAFHRDLDVWLRGQEKALEQELKRYSIDIFSFVKK